MSGLAALTSWGESFKLLIYSIYSFNRIVIDLATIVLELVS